MVLCSWTITSIIQFVNFTGRVLFMFILAIILKSIMNAFVVDDECVTLIIIVVFEWL